MNNDPHIFCEENRCAQLMAGKPECAAGCCRLLAPVPAQGAEGVEALAAEVGAYYDFGLGKHGPPFYVFTEVELSEFVRRLRNSPESTGLLSLLADIRAAAGDSTGKLMQEELVAHIRSLREDAERLDELERLANSGGVLLHDGSDYEAAMQTAVGIGLRPGALVRSLRAAIDAARSEGGDDA